MKTPFRINTQVDQAERGEVLAEILSDFVNNYNAPEEDFIKSFKLQHRTLQQSMIRLFLKTMVDYAELDNYDGRNEGAVKMCKELVELYEEKHGCKPLYLPFV